MVLTAEVFPADADTKEVTWSSSNSDIAYVDGNGEVTGIKSGKSYIYATLGSNTSISDSCLINVHQPVTAIKLSSSSILLNVGETYDLDVSFTPNDADNKKVIWHSDNNKTAVVDNGKVSAINTGSAKIYAISEEDSMIYDYCEVTIVQPVSGISLSYDSYKFSRIGETIQLEAVVYPENASNKNVNWKSSNENVCIVSNGMVVALSPGTSIIIATTVDGGYMATCTISVEIDTSINYINESNSNSNFKVYSIDGRMRQSLQRGINIIVFENGQRMKVYVKE